MRSSNCADGTCISSGTNQRQHLRDECLTPRSCQGWGEVRASARVSSTQTLVSQGCVVLFTVLFVVDFFPTSKDSLLSILSPPTTHSFVPLYTGSPSFPFLLLRQVLLSTRLRGRERAQGMLEAQPLLLIWHVSSSVAQLLKALAWFPSHQPLGSTSCLLALTFTVCPCAHAVVRVGFSVF